MSEKSEVQNLDQAAPAKEALDAAPPAAAAGQVQQGEPKHYPEQVGEDSYPTGEGPAH